MTFIGIDPGDKGAIAILGNSNTLYTEQFISHHRYLTLMKRESVDLICLEKLWGYPISSAAVNFNLGTHFGINKYNIEIAGISSIEVAAKTWQLKILNYRGGDKNASKKASVAYVNKRFPAMKLTYKNKEQLDLVSGISDAVCLALYAQFIHVNKI